MSGSISSAEYLGICIIVADNNLDMSGREVIKRLHAFQNDKNRRFTEDRFEFPIGFRHLFERIQNRTMWKRKIMLKKRTLGYYAPVILHYDGYHWNDEGEDWFKYGPKEIEQMEWFDKMGLSKQDCYYDGSGDFGGIKWNNRRCDREFLLRAGEPFYEWLIQESCEFDRMLRELFSHGTADRATLLKLFWEGRYQRWIPYLWSQPGGDKIPEDKE